MEKMPFPYGAEARGPTDDDRDPLAFAAPAISTAVLLVEGLVLGWLVVMASALCGNSCHDNHNEPTFSLILKVCGCGLVVPVGLLLISWLLPWRRRHNESRLAAAILAPLSRRAFGPDLTGGFRQHAGMTVRPCRNDGSTQCTNGRFDITVRTAGPMPTGSHRPRRGRSPTAGPDLEVA